MGIPLLFTDAGGTTPDLIVVPFAGLYPSDNLFPGEDVFPDDGPTLDFFATAPAVVTFGVTVDVTPVPAVFFATAPTLNVTEVNVAVFPLPVTFRATPPTLGGQDVVVPVTPIPVVFGATPPTSSGGQLIILVPSVRELPPLRLHLDIETPSGRHFRWGEDEPNPANVPSGLRFSDTMPGGFENQDATLPRKTGMSAGDLEPLSTVRLYGAGGELAWEGRLEAAPRTSGDQTAVSPRAVGWQAHLEDDKSAQVVYVDRDLSHWGSISATRDLALLGGSPQFVSSQGNVETQGDNEVTGGLPAIKLSTPSLDAVVGVRSSMAETWYDGQGAPLGNVYFDTVPAGGMGAGWVAQAVLSIDELTSATDVSTINAASAFAQYLTGTATRYHAFLNLYYNGTATGDGAWARFFRKVAVYGNHSLPRRGPDPGGFYSSDIVAHAVATWAPLLRSDVQQSSFIVPHAAFLDRTTAGEIIRQATRFGLQDWAVWDDKTFWWHDRGARGRKWRARVSPAQLEETGASLERTWNSVIVQYSDVDGSTRTVGPPSSGADTEDPVLKDLDPENPANQAGIIRRDLLQMGTGTAASAVEVGRQFLERSKELDSSGRARFVGHIETDKGVTYPYWAVRAGDTVSFVDAADTSPRRIIRTEKDHSSRTCSVDLDAPPSGLEQLLERLQVVLVPLGVS